MKKAMLFFTLLSGVSSVLGSSSSSSSSAFQAKTKQDASSQAQNSTASAASLAAAALSSAATQAVVAQAPSSFPFNTSVEPSLPDVNVLVNSTLLYRCRALTSENDTLKSQVESLCAELSKSQSAYEQLLKEQMVSKLSKVENPKQEKEFLESPEAIKLYRQFDELYRQFELKKRKTAFIESWQTVIAKHRATFDINKEQKLTFRVKRLGSREFSISGLYPSDLVLSIYQMVLEHEGATNLIKSDGKELMITDTITIRDSGLLDGASLILVGQKVEDLIIK